ncbi:fatty acid CoA ligase family protein [Streptomyces murinus]|uniref:fatty acid CoA ligase family protein n=1 Tax=Streptomyces murinus TaxID=33900 RepID=UPI00380BDFE4
MYTASGLAAFLEHNARLFPARTAIIHPDGREPDGRIRYREMDYATLQSQVEQLAAGFARAGIGKGTRTVLMAAPGPDLFAIAFALFRLGAVPVIVDPGMGIRRMLHCYRAVGAEAFIGPPVAHVARVLGRRTFAGVRTKVTLGRRLFWGGQTLDELRDTSARRLPVAGGGRGEVGGEDLMMIGFTTGSTGPAKGVEFTHRMGVAMARGLRAAHSRTRGDVSLVTLPLYGMFDLVFGSTLVLAPVAPARVADADPGLLVDALTRFGVTTMFASPALLRVLARHMAGSALPPTLRCVVSGGAPVPPDLVAELRAVLHAKAEFHVTYGATEVLPIASVESTEILRETAPLGALGAGTCVGRPLAGLDVRTIPVSEGRVSRIEPVDGPPDTVGEIVVAGDAVSPGYHCNPRADALHKVRAEGRIWHRTGDLGYLDGHGRLWFCGRKSQRVRTAGGDLHTVICEGVFNAHPLVRRSALVGVGGDDGAPAHPVVCVETEGDVDEAGWKAMLPELRRLAAAQSVTAGLHDFLRHRAFPVDIRHNAKIGREELAVWAAHELAAAQGRLRTWTLRAIPLAGWAYLIYGAVRPFDALPWTLLWWTDAFLSVVVHAAQIPAALPRGRMSGRSAAATAGLTMLYGATWWRTLPTAQRAARPQTRPTSGVGAS